MAVDNKIDVDGFGNFTYGFALLTLPYKGEEEVRWHSPHQFTVSFPEGSPFPLVTIESKPTKGSEWEAFSGRFSPPAPRIYHYHVAVRLTEGQIFVDGGCPGVKPR